MPAFVKLPSGVVLSLALIRDVTPRDRSGSATVHFGEGDSLELSPEDAAVLNRRLGTTGVSTYGRTVIFWLVIMCLIGLVWLVMTAGRR